MKQEQPVRIHRADYRQPDHWIDAVDLRFELGEDSTRVLAKLQVRRNESAVDGAPLRLDGEELSLDSIRVDGEAWTDFEAGPEALVVRGLPAAFELETTVTLRPQENTALMGLYRSSGNFCTQCEAEGFRRITYFADRPDVMAVYGVTIVGDGERYPVMLSNGNRVAEGTEADGRRWVRWEDPHPKPSYLFALVAGTLEAHAGEFTTRSGRKVKLEVFVEPKDIDSAAHAYESLVRSMKWDEDVFGLECDLDNYMVVAVSDFNMGAMENKGLNIFNSKFVLARPETATDDDYEAIEEVIGHEYFHNWTGNRVTCRDWFQLTLKEGLTVYRDQRFSADMTSAPVKRIGDVRGLRVGQFREDSGPMAHPIRPESYIEMNNFYTSTVYRKGAEVVRMYASLLGTEGFRRGMDLYFERHDGQAVTCDDFRAALADANGRDLGQFERWYTQAGTPILEAEGSYDPGAQTYSLTLRQTRPAIPDQPDYEPMLMPVAVGLMDASGSDLALRLSGEDSPGAETRVLELSASEQTYVFVDVAAEPVPSILRGFSAPVILRMQRSREQLAFQMAHDSDSFKRWDAGQELAQEVLLGLIDDHAAGRELTLDAAFAAAWGRILADGSLDGSLKALALALPAEMHLGSQREPVPVEGIHAARTFLRQALAQHHRSALLATYQECSPAVAYSNDKASIDRRRLRSATLSYLGILGGVEERALAVTQFEGADNMTDAQAALMVLADAPGAEREKALEDFHAKWKHDALVVDKWFAVQALSGAEDTLERVQALA